MVKNSFQLQMRLKSYSKNRFFSKFSIDLKNVSRHCIVGVLTTSKLTILKTFFQESSRVRVRTEFPINTVL